MGDVIPTRGHRRQPYNLSHRKGQARFARPLRGPLALPENARQVGDCPHDEMTDRRPLTVFATLGSKYSIGEPNRTSPDMTSARRWSPSVS